MTQPAIIIPVLKEAKNIHELRENIIQTIRDLHQNRITIAEASCMERLYRDVLRSVDIQVAQNKALGVVEPIRFVSPAGINLSKNKQKDDPIRISIVSDKV